MFNEIFTQVIISLILGIISYLAIFVHKQISDLINNKVKNEKIKNCLETANSIVEQSVFCVTQTYVDELKKQGSFDCNAHKTALSKAKNIACDMLTSDVLEVIRSTYGDFDEWLNTKIEEVIQKSK